MKSLVGIISCIFTFSFTITFCTSDQLSRPNFIVFLADDMGYADLSTYGHPTQEDGHIDRMAREGLKLTQLYAAASSCTPSRAALLTGRQPFRTGMIGPSLVHLPHQKSGLSHDEVTLTKALKQHGYTTGMVGKWHLGINNHTSTDGVFLPQTHGFDFVGTMLPFTLAYWCDTDKHFIPEPLRHYCFVYRDKTVVQQPIDLTQLTAAMVLDAKSFLYDNAEKPFFFYFSFPQVHTPMFNMAEFKGSSKRGTYGDQINEMSWAVGEVLDTVKQLGLSDNTLSVFLSDHGPHLEMCHWGGKATPFSGGKLGYQEGGLRVPGILHWPGVIQPGSVSTKVASLMDIFPTFLELAGIELPQDRIIDGKSFVDLILKHGTKDITKVNSDKGQTRNRKVTKVTNQGSLDIAFTTKVCSNNTGKTNIKTNTTTNRYKNIPVTYQKRMNTCDSSQDVLQRQNTDNINANSAEMAVNLERALFIYDAVNDVLAAARYKEYKIYFTTMPPKNITYTQNCKDNGLPIKDIFYVLDYKPETLDIPDLYNIELDPAEDFPLDINSYPDLMQEIRILLDKEKLTWTDRRMIQLTNSLKDNSILPCCNPPFCFCKPKLSLSSYGVCEIMTSSEQKYPKRELAIYVYIVKISIVSLALTFK